MNHNSNMFSTKFIISVTFLLLLFSQLNYAKSIDKEIIRSEASRLLNKLANQKQQLKAQIEKEEEDAQNDVDFDFDIEEEEKFVADLLNRYLQIKSAIGKLTVKASSEYNSNSDETAATVNELQKMFKKSWNLPMKSLTWYSQNTGKSSAPQEMYDQLAGAIHV